MVSRELRWVRMEWPASNTCFVTAAVRFPYSNRENELTTLNSLTQQVTSKYNKHSKYKH